MIGTSIEKVEKEIDDAIRLWEYALSHADSVVSEFQDPKVFGGKEREYNIGDLFLAQKEADDVVCHTSDGSYYRNLVENNNLQSRYNGKFVELWSKSKIIRIAASEQIDVLFKK